MGGPPLHRTHLVGVEDGLPSRSPQLGGAHGVLPVAAPAIGRLETTLDNLALAATNDTAVLQQLTSANLALTATIGMLTAANKKLADAVARGMGPPAVTPGGGGRSTRLCTLGTTAGRMDIASASSTPEPPAPTRRQAIAKMPRRPTPLAVVTRTKVGTRRAPDGGGWQI